MAAQPHEICQVQCGINRKICNIHCKKIGTHSFTMCGNMQQYFINLLGIFKEVFFANSMAKCLNFKHITRLDPL